MTNGRGKSDRPVVPGKSPNKAGQPVAEEMEGSGWLPAPLVCHPYPLRRMGVIT